MNQTIEFITLKECKITSNNIDAFQFRNDRPAQWLQKLCFFVLKKLRAFYLNEKITIERHTINQRNFMERLFEQKYELTKFFNRESTVLLIGAEDYAELMHEVAATQIFSFRAEYGYGKKILGMTVKVIPWMRGCVVMPSDD